MTPSSFPIAPATVVPVGNRVVGAGHPVLIVAEAGVNHDGDVKNALNLVDAAAASGADAVKFQVFSAKALVTAHARTADYQRRSTGEATQQAMLERLELDDAALRRLRDHATARGLLFLATPFGLQDVRRLTALNIPAIKIASTDLVNTLLLRAAVDTGRPMIVSTGAATESEIHEACRRLRESGAADRLILMHCVSAYPTPIEAANLAALRTLARLGGVPVGFSDHTTCTKIGAWAACAGACVLEKHLTLDRAAAGPDHAASLDPSMFAEYVRAVRRAESALGRGSLGMQPIEADVRAAARRSVVAARTIARGSLLTADMLAVKRPGGGIAPDQLTELVGRVARADIPTDAVLSWSMVQ